MASWLTFSRFFGFSGINKIEICTNQNNQNIGITFPFDNISVSVRNFAPHFSIRVDGTIIFESSSNFCFIVTICWLTLSFCAITSFSATESEMCKFDHTKVESMKVKNEEWWKKKSKVEIGPLKFDQKSNFNSLKLAKIKIWTFLKV